MVLRGFETHTSERGTGCVTGPGQRACTVHEVISAIYILTGSTVMPSLREPWPIHT
jgi:hypothetical protein